MLIEPFHRLRHHEVRPEAFQFFVIRKELLFTALEMNKVHCGDISILKEVFAMNETDYNARLYEKMKAEQDKYRDWLVRQEPSEILNHTYEYTMREDIVMCMEELELEPEKARAFLRSPCPLSDV